MKLTNLPTSITHWSTLPTEEHSGDSGSATVRAQQFPELQLRMVEYSAAYVADHWCYKGHIILVLSGEMQLEHQDGQIFTLPAGTSYHVADNEASPHRVRSENGAMAFLVD